jgi:hypothetical protein
VLAGFANRGATTVDLAAPGVDILSATIGGWETRSGTSFSVPFTAGVAALMRTIEPDLEAAGVRFGLMESVDRLGTLEGVVVSGGRLDAGRAIARLTEPNVDPRALASVSPTLGVSPLQVSLDGSGSTDRDGAVLAWHWDAEGRLVDGPVATASILEPGTHEIRLDVTDDRGGTDSDVVTVIVGADFDDVQSNIFANDIAWLSGMGITVGCNPPTNDRFCPNATVTRGELAAFLTRALGLPATAHDAFTDDDTSIFANDIDRLAGAGIARGCNPPTNDHFCPNATLTRAQIAAFLHRALG